MGWASDLYYGVPLAYGVVSATYIWLSDMLMVGLLEDLSDLLWFGLAKGTIFVLLTTLLLFSLLRRYTWLLQRENERTIQVYRASIDASQHLIRNFLNEAQLVRVEVEQQNSAGTQDALAIMDASTETIVEQLDELDRLKTISAEEIQAIAYRGLKSAVAINEEVRQVANPR